MTFALSLMNHVLGVNSIVKWNIVVWEHSRCGQSIPSANNLTCDLLPWTSESPTYVPSLKVVSCVMGKQLHWRHIKQESYSLRFSLIRSHSSVCWYRHEGTEREVALLGTPPGRDVEQKLYQIIPPAESAGSHWSICSPLWITVPQIESCCLATLYISILLLTPQ